MSLPGSSPSRPIPPWGASIPGPPIAWWALLTPSSGPGPSRPWSPSAAAPHRSPARPWPRPVGRGKTAVLMVLAGINRTEARRLEVTHGHLRHALLGNGVPYGVRARTLAG